MTGNEEIWTYSWGNEENATVCQIRREADEGIGLYSLEEEIRIEVKRFLEICEISCCLLGTSGILACDRYTSQRTWSHLIEIQAASLDLMCVAWMEI